MKWEEIGVKRGIHNVKIMLKTTIAGGGHRISTLRGPNYY